MPVFGGWLRNVDDEGNAGGRGATCAIWRGRSERIGSTCRSSPSSTLNDIKGPEAPALDAWSTARRSAAVTESARAHGRGLLPTPTTGLFAKRAANSDRISEGGSPSMSVSSWWKEAVQRTHELERSVTAASAAAVDQAVERRAPPAPLMSLRLSSGDERQVEPECARAPRQIAHVAPRRRHAFRHRTLRSQPPNTGIQ